MNRDNSSIQGFSSRNWNAKNIGRKARKIQCSAGCGLLYSSPLQKGHTNTALFGRTFLSPGNGLPRRSFQPRGFSQCGHFSFGISLTVIHMTKTSGHALIIRTRQLPFKPLMNRRLSSFRPINKLNNTDSFKPFHSSII